MNHAAKRRIAYVVIFISSFVMVYGVGTYFQWRRGPGHDLARNTRAGFITTVATSSVTISGRGTVTDVLISPTTTILYGRVATTTQALSIHTFVMAEGDVTPDGTIVARIIRILTSHAPNDALPH